MTCYSGSGEIPSGHLHSVQINNPYPHPRVAVIYPLGKGALRKELERIERQWVWCRRLRWLPWRVRKWLHALGPITLLSVSVTGFGGYTWDPKLPGVAGPLIERSWLELEEGLTAVIYTIPIDWSVYGVRN